MFVNLAVFMYLQLAFVLSFFIMNVITRYLFQPRTFNFSLFTYNIHQHTNILKRQECFSSFYTVFYISNFMFAADQTPVVDSSGPVRKITSASSVIAAKVSNFVSLRLILMCFSSKCKFELQYRQKVHCYRKVCFKPKIYFSSSVLVNLSMIIFASENLGLNLEV